MHDESGCECEKFLKAGIEATSAGAFEKAKGCYERALSVHDDNVAAWCNLGFCYDELGNLSKALECYEKALTYDPHHKHSLVSKGSVLARNKRFEEALVCFEKAILVDPTFQLAIENRLRALNDLGRTPSSFPHEASRERREVPRSLNEVLMPVVFEKGILERGQEFGFVPEAESIIAAGSKHLFEVLKDISKGKHTYDPQFVGKCCCYLFGKGVEAVIAWGQTPLDEMKSGKLSVLYNASHVVDMELQAEVPDKYGSLVQASCALGGFLCDAHIDWCEQRIKVGASEDIDLAEEVRQLFLFCSRAGIAYALSKKYHELPGAKGIVYHEQFPTPQKYYGEDGAGLEVAGSEYVVPNNSIETAVPIMCSYNEYVFAERLFVGKEIEVLGHRNYVVDGKRYEILNVLEKENGCKHDLFFEITGFFGRGEVISPQLNLPPPLAPRRLVDFLGDEGQLIARNLKAKMHVDVSETTITFEPWSSEMLSCYVAIWFPAENNIQVTPIRHYFNRNTDIPILHGYFFYRMMLDHQIQHLIDKHKREVTEVAVMSDYWQPTPGRDCLRFQKLQGYTFANDLINFTFFTHKSGAFDDLNEQRAFWASVSTGFEKKLFDLQEIRKSIVDSDVDAQLRDLLSSIAEHAWEGTQRDKSAGPIAPE